MPDQYVHRRALPARTSFAAHRFWEYQDAEQEIQQTQFLKNFAILGGLCALFACGAGRFALDRLLAGPRADRSGADAPRRASQL
jgi:putative oxidoreductase